MVALSIILDGTVEGSGPPFDPQTMPYTRTLAVIGMPNGTASGAPTVLLRLTLADGREVFAETSLKLFLTAADALRARYGDSRFTEET